jgi:hypothetical protein
MQLLCFAHRGEAQIFLQELDLKAHPKIQNFYIGESYHLLLTGEGPWRVMENLGPVLGAYEYTAILNFGIAGALNTQAKKNEIYSIRTFYFEDEFQSYSSSNLDTKWDAITSKNRVLTDQYASELELTAPIVDREGWAIGRLAQKLGIPFQSFKLISDVAGEETQCFDLKQKAQEFSFRLYEHFKSLDPLNSRELQLTLDLTGFYFTTSQKRSFQQKLKKIIKIFPDKGEKFFEQLSSQIPLDLKPKQRTNQLLEKMEKLINPIQYELQKKQNEFFSTLDPAKITFPSLTEDPSFQLGIKIQNEKEWDQFIRKAKAFSYKEYQSFIDGRD